jgi:threonine dehydrogenase-like Zn-dependent dehydrogenase
MKNRIARLVKIKKIKIFEEELPELKDGEILVKIKAVGICGSDTF